MGFLGGILGDSQETKQNTKTKESFKRDRTETSEQKVTGTKEETSTKTGQLAETQTTQQFSDQDLAILQGLTSSLAEEGNVFGEDTLDALGDVGDFGRDVAARAGNGLSFVNDAIAAAKASAIQGFEDTEEPLLMRFAQEQAGSRLNSATALMRDQARRKLGTDLASIEGSLRFQGEELEQSRIAQGLQGLQAGADAGIVGDRGETEALQNLLASLGAARGSVATSTGTREFSEQEQATQFLETLSEALSKINETGTGTSESSGTSETQQNPGLLSVISAFM